MQHDSVLSYPQWAQIEDQEVLFKGVCILGKYDHLLAHCTTLFCTLIPKHSFFSGEPRECSIGCIPGAVVQTGVMFLPEFA